MKIGLSARWLMLPPGGAREYTLNLIRALLEIDQRNDYFVFHGNAVWMGTFPTAKEILLASKNKLYWDYVALPAAVRQHRIDLFWTPAYIVPFTMPCKSVAAVHDLAYFLLPQSYPLVDRWYMRATMPGSFRRAQALLAVSEHTRLDMERLFPFTRGKITVTYEAAATRFHQRLTSTQLAVVQSRYHLSAPFIFYAGSISPRKGLPYLLKAFAYLKQERGIPQRLVFTGGWTWGDEAIRDLIQRLGIQAEVVILGNVAPDDMPALYQLADVFVYPSLYEGFGLPILEAMASGCPVVCSNLTALPEVAGDAATMIDPRDTTALADAIYRVLCDESERVRLCAKGLARAKRFSWQATARKTLDVFETVMEDSANG
jgi:glycosyltransferase involved in cell wall biosynthesis